MPFTHGNHPPTPIPPPSHPHPTNLKSQLSPNSWFGFMVGGLARFPRTLYKNRGWFPQTTNPAPILLLCSLPSGKMAHQFLEITHPPTSHPHPTHIPPISHPHPTRSPPTHPHPTHPTNPKPTAPSASSRAPGPPGHRAHPHGPGQRHKGRHALGALHCEAPGPQQLVLHLGQNRPTPPCQPRRRAAEPSVEPPSVDQNPPTANKSRPEIDKNPPGGSLRRAFFRGDPGLLKGARCVWSSLGKGNSSGN